MKLQHAFRFGLIAGILACGLTTPLHAQTAPTSAVEQWGTFEVALKGPADGNPFLDVQLGATFTHGKSTMFVDGFYDGDGTYRVRFMPTEQGDWQYKTKSNRPALDGKEGGFTCGKPSADNHGPVHVARTFHFDYADGTPYFEIGTTCYNWHHELDAQEEQTLETLKASPFDKVRMCVLPTSFPNKRGLYPYITADGSIPPVAQPARGARGAAVASVPPPDAAAGDAPAAGGGGGGRGRGPVVPMPPWDYTRLNPAFFQHLEKRVADLRAINVQADLILYTPYDNHNATGFNGANAQGRGVDAAGDERYLKYMVARLGAYRNVWWSMANEYDLMGKTIPGKKDDAVWDKLCQIVSNADAYHHLLSIHFSQHIYTGNNQPWITHISIQNGSAVADFGRANLYRDVYYKPIVFDEVNYEGKSTARWGQLTGQEMTEQFWYGWIDGTYVGHGETLGSWVSAGGTLKGESPARLAFLKKVMETGPATGINPVDKWRDQYTAGKGPDYYLIYFGRETPTEWYFSLPAKEGLAAGMNYKVEILDTWNMTVTPVEGVFTTVAASTRYVFVAKGDAKVTMPGKPFMALRITRVP